MYDPEVSNVVVQAMSEHRGLDITYRLLTDDFRFVYLSWAILPFSGYRHRGKEYVLCYCHAKPGGPRTLPIGNITKARLRDKKVSVVAYRALQKAFPELGEAKDSSWEPFAGVDLITEDEQAT
jgi:hypothetical protein